MAVVPGDFIEFDDYGNVTEIGGLGLKPSPHRSIVRGETLYTWCAPDSLFVPEIIGELVEIASKISISAEEVRIVPNENGTMDVRPACSVMTFATPEFEVMHGPDSVGDIRFAFCDCVCFLFVGNRGIGMA